MESKGQNTETGVATSPCEGLLPEAGVLKLQLERLLASPHFRSSKRCQALLRYVVDAHLEGALDRVKERTIGFEVFHRQAGYDTNHDSVVRTTAAEVRKRLAQYYLEPEHEHELRVSLPSGAYAPEFRLPTPNAPRVEVVAGIKPTPVVPSPSIWRFSPVAAAIALAVGAAWWWPRETALERFWNPLTTDRADAVICIGQPLKVYRIDGPRSDELNDKIVGNGTLEPAAKEVLEATALKLSDLRPAGNQYFTSGDLMASVRLAELLAQRRKPFQVLGDRGASYYDLRGKPAILIGQFSNRWTQEVASGLRFYMERNTAKRLYEVHDRQNPETLVASASQEPDRHEEYAIVTRVFNPSTEKTVVAIMGMTYKGTVAGSDFVTNAGYLQEAFQRAEANWDRKNIQVVLRTPMVGGNAGPPKVVTKYFW